MRSSHLAAKTTTAIAPVHFCQSHTPLRYIGPHAGQRLDFLHTHVNPLPEFPALTHFQKVWCRPEHKVPPHIHATAELTYVVSGRGRWQVESQSVDVRAGDFWIVRPGELHYGGADPTDPYRIFVIGMDPAALLQPDEPARNRWLLDKQRVNQRRAQGALLLNPPAADWPLADHSQPPYNFGALEDRRLEGAFELAPLFEQLLRELDAAAESSFGSSSRGLSVLMIRSLLLQLFVQVARCHAREKPADRFALLCQWLQTRLQSPPSVREMAAFIDLSPAYFAEQFKSRTGLTPHSYLELCRIEEAARRLAHTRESSITQIALDLGFSSSQYFSVAFRKHKGCTPSQWRCEPRHREGYATSLNNRNRD